MAWTNPKTWSSEPLTSADLNTYVRDNQEHIKDRLDNSAGKTVSGQSDISASSETFVDVDSARLSIDLTTHGGDALVGFTGTVKCSLVNGPVYFNLSVDGVDYFAGDGITLYVISDNGEVNHFKPVSFRGAGFRPGRGRAHFPPALEDAQVQHRHHENRQPASAVLGQGTLARRAKEMAMHFEHVFQILTLALVALVYWLAFRSFPPRETAQLIQRLDEVSQRTESRLDDLLVDIARLLNELRVDRDDAQETDG